jgi:hypothetical protein
VERPCRTPPSNGSGWLGQPWPLGSPAERVAFGRGSRPIRRLAGWYLSRWHLSSPLFERRLGRGGGHHHLRRTHRVVARCVLSGLWLSWLAAGAAVAEENATPLAVIPAIGHATRFFDFSP